MKNLDYGKGYGMYTEENLLQEKLEGKEVLQAQAQKEQRQHTRG